MSESQELNLLVVDWDFFFPNPSYGARIGEDVLLYDWTHAETQFHTGELIWGTRANGFLRNDLPLPKCRDYENFWSRFNFDEEGAPLLFGDSNLHAAFIRPATFGWDQQAWSTVSLWDAHHDSGYPDPRKYQSLAEWRERGTVTCEDWMLVHHDLGSRLEVVYPSWRTRVEGIETGPLIEVNRRIDDGSKPDTVYHAVYVCRSGAWVPSWCDEQFEEFLASFGGPGMEVSGNQWVQPRPDVVAQARKVLELQQRFGHLLAEESLKSSDTWG
ncbi:hypothetical protein [Streptomyces sp. NPDC053048]|uniref:hypothetical protein n=1 Tax=Streptomyces sp. NPDC053048 TaxID=3365694 RepID=UPI0037CD09A6